MPYYRCCVGGCNNDSRYPDRIIKRGHVEILKFHYFPKNPEKRLLWVKQVSKGLVGFQVSNNKTVCSNHFEYGKPTFGSPNPTFYLVVSDNKRTSPQKRKMPNYKIDFHAANKKIQRSPFESVGVQCELNYKSDLNFAQITRECDVNFYTGLRSSAAFKMMFEHVQTKAVELHYWRAQKNTSKDLSSPRDKRNAATRSLTLEQEFLLTVMRLRLRLLIDDLCFRFNVSEGLVSMIFTTWLRLLSKELSWLIHWPERNIKRNLPANFRKYYPKCCVIIDCSELFIETPSSLDTSAMCWSNYKHHSTVKYLVGITPNGAVSYLSDCYGGRASDQFIVNDSNFLQYLRPCDEVMAD